MKKQFDGSNLTKLGLVPVECSELNLERFSALHRNVGEICLYDVRDRLNKALEILGSDVRVTEGAYRSVFSPDMLEGPLENFVAPKKFEPRNKAALSRAVDRVTKKFVKHPGAVKPITLDEAHQILLNDKKDHFAGLPTLGKKGDDVCALERAAQCWEGKCPPPPVIGHRGKNSTVCRAVWMFPFEWHIVEASYYYPLYSEYSMSQSIYPVGPLNTRRYYFRKYSSIEGMNTKFSIDYSGFDGTVSTQMIGLAFGIIRQMLTLSDEEQKVWERVCTYFATSPFLAPDGKVYKGRRGGVPSGSMFTQLVDSLVNAIAIEYATEMSGVTKYRYTVYGDDSWIICESREAPDELIRKFKNHVETLGLKMHGPEKTEYAAPDEAIVFCGHYDIRRGRPLQDAVDKLCYPERPSKELTTREGKCERLMQYIADADCTALNALFLSYAYDLPIEQILYAEGYTNLTEVMMLSPTSTNTRHSPGILQVLNIPKVGSTLMRIRAAL